MAGKFQPPPVQGQVFLDADGAPSYPWKQWFELIPPALTSPASSSGPPAASSAPNAPGIVGQIAFDQNFIYVCIQSASATQKAVWKRAALSAW